MRVQLDAARIPKSDPVPLEAFQPFVNMAQEQGGIPASGEVLDREGRWIGYSYAHTPFVEAIDLAKYARLARL